MSRDFIGSKIAVVTKSQCRYVGTIIGIDAQTSSIILGNVKCFGIENRSGHSTNGHKPGTILPIMQFANSDIEDLKIVDEEQIPDTPKQQSYSMPVLSSPPSQQPSIHDDPAIVSAVVSSANKVNTSNSSISSRLIHNLQHMTLSDESSKVLSKTEESRIRSNSGELGASWSLLSPSKWEQNANSKPPSQQRSDHKSKFFDDFISNNNNNNNNNTNQFQSNRSHHRSSNTNSTQTSRENGNHHNGQYDDSELPVRQPFFSDERPYPQKQQSHYPNGNHHQQHQHQQQHQQPQQHQQQQQQQQQRYFYNNRRPPMSSHQRRPGGGGNRETFQNNPTNYEDDFDFETSNLKFNKLSNDDELKPQPDLTLQAPIDSDSTTDYPLLYDKKKSFFDNLAITEPSDTSAPYMQNRSKNSDTFGYDAYQRQNNRSNGNGYRRPYNNYRQQQQRGGNDDYQYRQYNSNSNNNNNNGYQYRY